MLTSDALESHGCNYNTTIRATGLSPKTPAARCPISRTVVTIARSTTPIITPGYPPERGLPGMMKRLMTEDWSQMAAAANASPNHVSSDERWTNKAREANPALDDDQAYRLGQLLKKAHFVRMGKLSAEARRLAREAATELGSAEAA